jgi:Uma2 family endonuclease
MSAAAKTRYTPEQYLELERKAPYKSEYYDGYIYAMSGASREHNLATGNLSGELRSRLKGRPCEVYASDMRVWIGATRSYTYPDVVVVCGEPRFEDREVDSLLNPTVVVEVLSPSTEKYDRGKKFDQYRRLDSLREYVLVAQDEVFVVHYARRGDEWVLSDLDRREDVLRLESIDCAVPLIEIYERIQFPGAEASSEQMT